MHQSVSDEQKLRDELAEARGRYRAAVKWSRTVLDYKKSFEREEDFGEDELREYIEMLRKDSRDELRTVALDVKRLKGRIKFLQNSLMDLAKKGKRV